MARVGFGELAVAAAVEVPVVDGKPATRIQLLKMGVNRPRDGREAWHVRDLAHAQEIATLTARIAGSTDLVVDYDHQSEFGAKDGVGGTAPASGWISKVEAANDGIWAEVEWTGKAAAALEAREYRYISPVFGFDKKTRAVTAIKSAALTNTPAFDLPAVAASFNGEDMTLSKIAQALGLGADADEDAIVASIGTMNTSATAVASALGLGAGAKPDELVAAATAAKGGAVDPTKFVPAADFNALKAKVDTFDADRATASVDAAIKAGKLMPSSRDWGLGFFKQDETAWASWVAAAPVVIKSGSEAEGKDPPADTLTAEQTALCSQMGWDPALYLAQLKKDA